MIHPLEHPCYAVRFSVAVRNAVLLVRSSEFLAPRSLRLRGNGILRQATVADLEQLVGGGVPFEALADRLGHPHSPRAGVVSDDDALDDSSDGPPIDWAVFGRKHFLKLDLAFTEEDARLHVVLTVLGIPPGTTAYPTTSGAWPKVSFQYADESAWNTATVLDYNTRSGEWGET